mgnify:CR=1 FL=1
MPTLINHGRARFDYEILESFEAGIKLSGFEVKSVKKGQGNLEGAHVVIRGGEAFIVNMFVSPYQENNTPAGYEARRNRKLMLSRKEIRHLASVESGKGLTIVPISVYDKGTLVKVSIAVVRGKKKYDKRETTKKRETDRNTRREFSDR